MFIDYKSDSIEYTGRWSEYDNSMTATAPGSYFRFSFKGSAAVLCFNMNWNSHPYPHIWIQIDDGSKIESTVENYIRIEANENKIHTVKVVFKSCVEMFHRWHTPLVGKVSFMGYEADEAVKIIPDSRKTIEFVGDSITEGVLINAEKEPDKNNGQYNRVFQDDSTATYAYLTAQKLNLIPLLMGYGAVGATHGGCGGTPAAYQGYPFCFDGHPVKYDSPDYILINHGANDRRESLADYTEYYGKLLDAIRLKNPESRLISLSPFCGAFHKELGEYIREYEKINGCEILYIDTFGWIPEEPLHPDRENHKIVSEKLSEILEKEFNL